jgi:hypothetical protein
MHIVSGQFFVGARGLRDWAKHLGPQAARPANCR